MNNKRELTEEERKNTKEWSENNSYLYELLCSLWENNIRTHACCAGHDVSVGQPYLGILIDNYSLPYIEKIVAGLQDMPDIVMSTNFRYSIDRQKY